MPSARPPASRTMRARLAALPLMIALAGCNPARIEAQTDYRGPALQRPERVLVRDFALSSGDVQLDQGLRARLTRMTGEASEGQQRVQVARSVDTTLADTLVQKLRSYGIPAARSAGTEPADRGATVTIEGRVIGVDEGNRTRRTLVGLGAGKSSFQTDAQLFYAEARAQPRLLETFEGTADSGHAPGAAETMGVGGAAGSSVAMSAAASAGLHGVSERRAAEPEDLARKTGEGLAARIGQYFVAQGWLPAGMVQ